MRSRQTLKPSFTHSKSNKLISRQQKQKMKSNKRNQIKLYTNYTYNKRRIQAYKNDRQTYIENSIINQNEIERKNIENILKNMIKKAFYQKYFLQQTCKICERQLTQICNYPFCREKRKLFCRECQKSSIDDIHFFHTSDHILSYEEIIHYSEHQYLWRIYIKITSDIALLDLANRLFFNRQYQYSFNKKMVQFKIYENRIYCCKYYQNQNKINLNSQDTNRQQVLIQSVYSQNFKVGNLINEFIQFIYQANPQRIQQKLRHKKQSFNFRYQILNWEYINRSLNFLLTQNYQDHPYQYYLDKLRRIDYNKNKQKSCKKIKYILPRHKISELEIHKYLQ